MRCLVLLLLILALAAASHISAEQQERAEDEEEVGEYGNNQYHRSLTTLPQYGLNATCQDKLCMMVETALSCKALNFGMQKICARYLLGYLYKCNPLFPYPSEIYNAPSVCIKQLAGVLPPGVISTGGKIVGGGGGSKSIIPDISSIVPTFSKTKAYLRSNFNVNCQMRCFQRYIEQTNDFYTTCGTELLNFTNPKNKNTHYPLVYTLESYAEFRNQVCATNDKGENCYTNIQEAFLPNTAPTRAPSLPPNVAVNAAIEAAVAAATSSSPEGAASSSAAAVIVAEEETKVQANPVPPTGTRYLSFDCDYNSVGVGGAYGPKAVANEQVFKNMCALLANQGCCAGNQVAMMSQSQTNASVPFGLHLFPPCLLRYLQIQCPSFDMSNFCTKGANGNMTTISGTVTMDKGLVVGVKNVPNAYDANAMLNLAGYISYGLPGFDLKLSKNPVLQVVIRNFVYYNESTATQSSVTQLTPANGSLYYPLWGDYENALSAKFEFDIILQGRTSEQSHEEYVLLTTQKACSCATPAACYFPLNFFYTNPVCKANNPQAILFVAEPFVLANAAAKTSGYSALSLLLVLGLASMLILS